MHIVNPLFLKPEDIWQILKLADDILLKEEAGVDYKPLLGKIVGLIFELPSCRTRISTEVAVYKLGGNCIYLGAQELGLPKREKIEDIGRVLSGYVDCIIARFASHDYIEELARASSVPVINALSNLFHPCQVISDIYTISKFKKKIVGLNLAYFGDGRNNIANTWLIIGSMIGMNIIIASPKEFLPREDILTEASNIASKNKTSIEITNEPTYAAKLADIIYTDRWLSMTDDIAEQNYKLSKLKNYQVNKELLSHAKKQVLVMHCLPASRGQEITDDVINSEKSIIFEQAKNRLHVKKGILVYLLS